VPEQPWDLATSLVRRIAGVVTETAGTGVAAAKVATRTRTLAPTRPDRLLGMAASFRHWGMTPAAAYAVGAARDPGRVAVVDERETATYADIDTRSSVVAEALAERGIGPGDRVAILARNSCGFIVAMVAASKLGADILYVNTGFAGPQLGDVLEREGAAAIVADEEFDELLDDVAGSLPRLTCWVDDDSNLPKDSIGGVLAAAEGKPAPQLPAPGRDAKQIILTSGTRGTPMGAARGAPGLVAGMLEGVAFLEAIPYQARGVTYLAAPAFHAWGLANLVVAMLMQSTLVLSRRFDPKRALELISENRVDTMVAVPVMCQRLLDVSSDADTSSLRIVSLSGSALAPTLATKFMDAYGDVLYSLYGSTEIAYVSVARPRDLREAPDSAGRVLRGVDLRIVDEDGKDVGPGETGRIFAGSAMQFEGYTSGEDKDRLGKLASTGDVGRIGDDGRLYIEGRDDDMIVSGGENVFPAEVEETLHQHSDVSDVAVVGVDDEKFGQALVAHVVLHDGASADEKALRGHVKKHLANYKVPREIVFHDELPRNETGKVVKRKLKDDEDESGEGDAGSA
jgi:fatty-acyl-CoA synthase